MEFAVETKTLAVDFSLDRDIFPHIASNLEGTEVGIFGIYYSLCNLCVMLVFHVIFIKNDIYEDLYD